VQPGLIPGASYFGSKMMEAKKMHAEHTSTPTDNISAEGNIKVAESDESAAQDLQNVIAVCKATDALQNGNPRSKTASSSIRARNEQDAGVVKKHERKKLPGLSRWRFGLFRS
jgi:hypothetical protein